MPGAKFFTLESRGRHGWSGTERLGRHSWSGTERLGRHGWSGTEHLGFHELHDTGVCVMDHRSYTEYTQ